MLPLRGGAVHPRPSSRTVRCGEHSALRTAGQTATTAQLDLKGSSSLTDFADTLRSARLHRVDLAGIIARNDTDPSRSARLHRVDLAGILARKDTDPSRSARLNRVDLAGILKMMNT